MSKQSGRTDEAEAVAAALASDPRALEAYSSASPAHLLDLLARACAACRADVSVFASSALLALARRGALPHEHWETALSVCTAPNCAEAARSQCARALAAAAARSPTALDDALALGQRGGIACWTALATECPHRGGDGAACWASAAAAALDAAARAGATVEAVACAARWLETGACLRRGGTGERPGASPLGAGGGALARAVGAAAASGDAGAARAACEVLEAAAAAGALRPGDDAELEALGAAHARARAAAAAADPAAARARRRFAAGLAAADPGATARGARPWAAGVLDDVAEGCVGPDAAAAEACCAAWAELVGGARPGPGVVARTRALVVRLVPRVVWPRGGLADGATDADADAGADAALHGDDAAALPENAGAWAERFEGDAYRWLRDEFIGWCLAAAAGALGAAAYVDAVLAGARRIDARDADVLAAAARCLAFAGPLLARGAAAGAAAAAALADAVHACAAGAAAAPPGPRRARLVAATALLLGGLDEWLGADAARLGAALRFLAYGTHVAGGAGPAYRAVAALARAQGAGAAAAPPDTWRELAAAAAARGSSCAALEALGAVAPRLGAEDRLAAAARCAAVGAAAAGAGAARVARAAFDALLEASDGDAAYLEACGGWRALAAALAGAPAEAAAAAADVAGAAAAREGLADASPLARLAPLLVERAARAAAEGDGDAAWSLCWALGEVGAALPPEALGHLRGAADALVAGLALPAAVEVAAAALARLVRRGVPETFVDSSLDTSIARRYAIAAASSRCL